MNGLFFTFLGSLVSLAVCVVIGYVCRKLRVLDDGHTAAFTTLLVKITLPCSVFNSMMRPFSRALLGESIATFLLSSAVFLAGGALGWLLARLLKAERGERRIWVFALIFANVGYMGFPVSQAVFGDEGLIYTSMANAAFNVLAFTVGIKLFTQPGNEAAGGGGEKNNGWKQLAFNPALLATAAGFILFITGFRLPGPVHDGIGLVGGMTSPVSMMLVGSILAKSPLRSLFNDIKILPVIIIRLAVIPLAAFFILRPFIHNPVMLGVIAMLSAMPVAAITVIFAEQYKADTALASKLVALSTLLCVATLPLFGLLLSF